MREHQASSAATTKQAPRLLNFDDVQRATGFINDVQYTGVENDRGVKPVLVFNDRNPRIITGIRIDESIIKSSIPWVLQPTIISELSAISARDLMMIEGGIAQIFRAILTPMTRLYVLRKDDVVEVTATIGDSRHVFTAQLDDVPELGAI